MTPLYQGTNFLAAATLRDVLGQFGLSQLFLSIYGGSIYNGSCGSCTEFLAGSPMVKKLNSGRGGAAVPGVQYTTIPTRYDELVVPYTSGILRARNAVNHVLQDVCPNDIDEHAAEASDPVVVQLILNALDPRHARRVSCAGLPPFAPAPQ